jgi:hypothetical protein
VKRYLNVATVAPDGLLIVCQEQPFAPTSERIIVPRPVLDGLVTALHIQLSHPTTHQLRKAIHRHFFALDMDSCIDRVSDSCHQCASLRKVPQSLMHNYSSEPPKNVGMACAADVIRRTRQCILVLREGVTSFTRACLIPDETAKTVGDSLVTLCIDMVPLDGPPLVVRVDPAPCFQSLTRSGSLDSYRITLDIGEAKNINKNPVAEKCVQELEDELVRIDPTGAPVSPVALAVAIATLNSRIRGRGLSAREMWFHRDMYTNEQLSFNDSDISLNQHDSRVNNHTHSLCSKFPKATKESPDILIGDIVYLHSDKSKVQGRSRYLVVSVDRGWCHVRKFAGSQLRSMTYKVRMSDCFRVPNDIPPRVIGSTSNCDSDEEFVTPLTVHPSPNASDSLPQRPPPPPVVPPLLTTVPNDVESGPVTTDTAISEPQLIEEPLDDIVSDTAPTANDVGHFDDQEPRRSERERQVPKYLQDYDLS